MSWIFNTKVFHRLGNFTFSIVFTIIVTDTISSMFFSWRNSTIHIYTWKNTWFSWWYLKQTIETNENGYNIETYEPNLCVIIDNIWICLCNSYPYAATSWDQNSTKSKHDKWIIRWPYSFRQWIEWNGSSISNLVGMTSFFLCVVPIVFLFLFFSFNFLFGLFILLIWWSWHIFFVLLIFNIFLILRWWYVSLLLSIYILILKRIYYHFYNN